MSDIPTSQTTHVEQTRVQSSATDTIPTGTATTYGTTTQPKKGVWQSIKEKAGKVAQSFGRSKGKNEATGTFGQHVRSGWNEGKVEGQIEGQIQNAAPNTTTTYTETTKY